MTDEELLRVLRERYLTDGPARLARELGCSIHKITHLARKHELTGERRRADPRLDAALRARYSVDGPGPIATDFSKDRRVVQNRANHLGLVWDKGPSCRWDAFEDPLTPDALYYYGLIWADGTIIPSGKSNIAMRLALTEPEWHLLYSLNEFLECRQDYVSDPYWYEGYGKWQRAFSVRETNLVLSLVGRGIAPRKSYKDPLVPQDIMDHPQFHHVARGWMDGDGWTTYGSRKKPRSHPVVSWCGSKAAMHQLHDKIVAEVGIKNRPPYLLKRKKDRTWVIQWAHWERDVIPLLRWLHQDGGPYAFRKHTRPLQQLAESGVVVPTTYQCPEMPVWTRPNAEEMVEYRLKLARGRERRRLAKEARAKPSNDRPQESSMFRYMAYEGRHPFCDGCGTAEEMARRLEAEAARLRRVGTDETGTVVASEVVVVTPDAATADRHGFELLVSNEVANRLFDTDNASAAAAYQEYRSRIIHMLETMFTMVPLTPREMQMVRLIPLPPALIEEFSENIGSLSGAAARMFLAVQGDEQDIVVC